MALVVEAQNGFFVDIIGRNDCHLREPRQIVGLGDELERFPRSV